MIAVINFLLLLGLYGVIYFFQTTLWGLIPAIIALVFVFWREKLKSSYAFTIVLIIALLMSFPGIIGRNMIRNGGFEEGMNGWWWISQWYSVQDNVYKQSQVDARISSDVKRTGHNSVRIDNRQEKGAQRYGVLSQQIVVWPNAVYNAGLSVKGIIHNESLWISISDEWSKNAGRYYVPEGTYNEWTRIGPFSLATDDGHDAVFKIISDAPAQYFIDDVRLTLNFWKTLQKIAGNLLKTYAA